MNTGFDVAVVIPTTLRQTLGRSVRSVFAQEISGRVQVLVGIDVAQGDAGQLDALRAECPAHVTLTVLDLGYSTSRRHGGLYDNAYGGALRTILTYAAGSRYVAYLDDDDWYGPTHLSALLAAIAGHGWAWSGRWLVDDRTGWTICRDEWDAVGPGQGINAERFGGFVNPSSLMLDKIACHTILPLWANAMFADGSGEDRLIFQKLVQFPCGATGDFTSYFQMTGRNVDDEHHVREFRKRGILWTSDRSLIQVAVAHAERARDLYEAGDREEAASECRAALAINPYHTEALELLDLIGPT